VPYNCRTPRQGLWTRQNPFAANRRIEYGATAEDRQTALIGCHRFRHRFHPVRDHPSRPGRQHCWPTPTDFPLDPEAAEHWSTTKPTAARSLKGVVRALMDRPSPFQE